MKKFLAILSLFLCSYSSALAATQSVITDYQSTNVTTSAWVQIVASTQYGVSKLHIFDSSGQSILLGLGSSGNEQIAAVIPPGGIEEMLLNIPTGSRVSFKAVSNSTSTDATSGENILMFIQQ